MGSRTVKFARVDNAARLLDGKPKRRRDVLGEPIAGPDGKPWFSIAEGQLKSAAQFRRAAYRRAGVRQEETE